MRTSPGVCEGSQSSVSLPCWWAFSSCSCMIMATENKRRGVWPTFGRGFRLFSHDVPSFTTFIPVNKEMLVSLICFYIFVLVAGFARRWLKCELGRRKTSYNSGLINYSVNASLLRILKDYVSFPALTDFFLLHGQTIHPSSQICTEAAAEIKLKLKILSSDNWENKACQSSVMTLIQYAPFKTCLAKVLP